MKPQQDANEEAPALEPGVPVKAYRNLEFLTGPDARVVRILCEYLEPQTRLQGKRAVIFFGSARTRPGHPTRGQDYALAADLAERLARWTVDQHEAQSRFHICTGGGPGIMSAAHEGAARVDDGLNIGLNISLPFEQHANPFVGDALGFEFHYFFMRKLWFANLAHGVVVFPGGFGTLDELFELLTLIQTQKYSSIPVVLFDSGFWGRLLNFDQLIEDGLISAGDVNLFRCCDTVDAAFEYLSSQVEAVVKRR